MADRSAEAQTDDILTAQMITFITVLSKFKKVADLNIGGRSSSLRRDHSARCIRVYLSL